MAANNPAALERSEPGQAISPMAAVVLEVCPIGPSIKVAS